MRKRRPWAWVGFIPTLMGLGLVVTTDKDFRRMGAGITLVILSLPIFIFASPGKCPRCGKTFDRRGLYHNQFTKRCLNCGIQIGDPQ